METLGDIVVRLRADFGNTETQLVGIRKSVTELGTAAEGAAKIIDASLDAQIEELQKQGLSLAQALEKLGSSVAGVQAPLAGAGQAAAKAAEQLKMFDEAAMVPFADAAGQLNMFADELEPIGRDAKNAATGVDALARAEEQAGNEAAQAGSRLESFRATAGQVFSELQRGASGLVTIGASLTGAITVPLVGVATAALKLSGELEQAKVAFTTMLGSAKAAQEHLDKLKAFAASTPFEFPDLVQASKRLQALGFAAKDVIPMLTAVGNTAAALGSGKEGIDRITLALGQMQMATKVTAQDMKQLTEAGVPAWQMLAKVLKTDVATAMDMVSKRAVDASTAIPALLAGMNEKFGKMMEEQAKTLTGQFSNFKDQLGYVLADIGEALAPLAKKLLSDVMMPLLEFAKDATSAFKALPEPIKMATIVVAGLAAAIGPLLVAIGGIGMAIGPVSTGLSALGGIFVALGQGITGVGASYTAMLATGILRATVWLALAAAIVEVGVAYHSMRSAQELAATAQKNAADSLATYEIALKRHGIDITELQNKYKSGLISTDDYIKQLGKLRDEFLKTHPVTAAHNTAIASTGTTSEAAAVRMKYLQDQVASTGKHLEEVTGKFKDHKATAAEVAKAYDEWKSATGALKSAQDALLPVVTNVHKATREFVNIWAREMPDAAKNAANAADALTVKVQMQSDQLISAQRYLDYVMEQWNKYHNNANEVVKALDALTKAQSNVNKSLGEMPDAAEIGKKLHDQILEVTKGFKLMALPREVGESYTDWQHRIEEATKAFNNMFPAITKAPPLVRTLAIDLYDLGIRARDAAGEITTKLLAAFEDLATKQKPTLEEAHLAWSKVQQDVQRLAKYDLPEALKVYGEYEALLKRIGASQGELLAVRKDYLGLEIKIAEQEGTSATKQIIALQNVKLAQGVLYDQTHLLGDLYVDVTNDILKGFDEMGKAFADAIFDSKNLGDAFVEVGKKIGKTILEDIIGTYFKALKDEILKSTGLLNGLSNAISKLFGGGSGGGGGAGTTIIDETGAAVNIGGGAIKSGTKSVSGAAGGGGLLGTANLITGIGQLISSIVGNFQMARLEGTMNAVEHNTRYLEIIFQKFAEQDEWQRHGEIIEALGNIFTRLGEVGVGVVRAVTETSAEVAETIRRQFRRGDVANEGRTPPGPPPYTFNGPDQIANGILNNLVRGGSATTTAIPGFASGGYVPYDMLAMLHEGEVVVPKTAVNQHTSMTYGSVGPISITVNGAQDPRETARQVAEYLKIVSPRHAAYGQ